MVTGDNRYPQRSRDLRHLLNGEWVIHILVALNAGPLHYNELYSAVQDMTTFDPWTGSVRRIQSRALGRTLRRIETGGLVDRFEERTFPRSVVYSLTPAAKELLIAVEPLIAWGEKHADLIEHLQKSQSKGREQPPSDGREPPPDGAAD